MQKPTIHQYGHSVSWPWNSLSPVRRPSLPVCMSGWLFGLFVCRPATSLPSSLPPSRARALSLSLPNEDQHRNYVQDDTSHTVALPEN